MTQIRNQTKIWILLSVSFWLLLTIRSLSAGIEFIKFITMWLVFFEIISSVKSLNKENTQILNGLFVLTASGIAVQCLMNQENLLSNSLIYRLLSYGIALISAFMMSYVLLYLFGKMTVRQSLIFWMVIHFGLLILICIFGSWEYGTLKHVMILGKPVQITVFTKLTAVLALSSLMNDHSLTESAKIRISAIFVLFNGVLFFYMRELGTFMIIAVLHLVMIARFIRSVCSLKKKYLLFWIVVLASGILMAVWILPAAGIQTAMLNKIQNRMLGAYDPALLDPSGAGYSANAARKAMLIGGAFGSTLTLHIPEANTDFVFSYVFLRFGIVSGLLLMLVYCFFLSSMIESSAKKTSQFETLAYGCAMTLFTQTGYNMAMCMGILPVCGINLTFISAGTMDLLTGLIMTFIVINSNGRRKRYVYFR